MDVRTVVDVVLVVEVGGSFNVWNFYCGERCCADDGMPAASSSSSSRKGDSQTTCRQRRNVGTPLIANCCPTYVDSECICLCVKYYKFKPVIHLQSHVSESQNRVHK